MNWEEVKLFLAVGPVSMIMVETNSGLYKFCLGVREHCYGSMNALEVLAMGSNKIASPED